MSTKIKCKTVNKGISLPTDRTGLEFACNAWAWLVTYTDDDTQVPDNSEARRGKVLAVVRLLNDMGIIERSTYDLYAVEASWNEYNAVRKDANQQLNVVTSILCR